MPQRYIKKILDARVYDVAIETPLTEARSLSKRFGNNIMLKREDLQPVFSFKIRGAYNRIAQLSEEQKAKGALLPAIMPRAWLWPQRSWASKPLL